MVLAQNPFTPGFGKHRRVVVGRDWMLTDIAEAFLAEWHPAFTVRPIVEITADAPPRTATGEVLKRELRDAWAAPAV